MNLNNTKQTFLNPNCNEEELIRGFLKRNQYLFEKFIGEGDFSKVVQAKSTKN